VTLADDLFRFCEGLRLEKPFLVGHSMGGTVSLMAHAYAGLQASGMVLIEPILLPSELYQSGIGVEQHPLASKAIRRTNFWRDRDEARAYLHSRSLFQDWDDEMLELYIRHGMSGNDGGLRLTCSPVREAALFMGVLQYDPWPILSGVSCPVLILEGEKSHNREHIDQNRIASSIPDCVYHLVGGAGHLIPMEKPREVTRLIRQFFAPLRPESKNGQERRQTGSRGEGGVRKKSSGASGRPEETGQAITWKGQRFHTQEGQAVGPEPGEVGSNI